MNIASIYPSQMPELATGVSSAKLQSAIETAVLSKVMDTAEQSSDAMLQMMRKSMELSVNPAVGSNIDLYA